MLTQAQVVSARRRRSASISLVLIASTVMVAGCNQSVSAGDVAYRNSYRSAEDCRRDNGVDCTTGGAGGRGGFYGPYIVNSASRPAASPNAVGVEQTVLTGETASRINSGFAASRSSFTARGGFGAEGGFGGEGGHGGGAGE